MLGERDGGAEAEGDLARRWGGVYTGSLGLQAQGMERESSSGLELVWAGFVEQVWLKHWEVFGFQWRELLLLRGVLQPCS